VACTPLRGRAELAEKADTGRFCDGLFKSGQGMQLPAFDIEFDRIDMVDSFGPDEFVTRHYFDAHGTDGFVCAIRQMHRGVFLRK